jgi:predicted transposase YdaD
MDTDKHLYKLFTAAPEQLYFLLGLAAPKEVRARAESFKEIQTESDLVAEPVEEIEPARMIEFHGYRDPRFVPKVMLRCALYRIRHPARSIRCHIVYLDREFESARVDDGGLFQPTIHYLPELVRQLTIHYPDSPLLSVLRPLVAESDQALIATAAADHERIRQAAGLTDEQRQAWLEVFHCWLMARLPMKLEEIRKMITRLPDVEETPWGQELKERWTGEARRRRTVQDDPTSD